MLKRSSREQIERAKAVAEGRSDNPRDDDPDLVELQKALPAYEIFGMLQTGGQGRIYRAVQRATRRVVAIKILLPAAFASRQQRLRFEREIALIARLRNPHIVTLYESGTACGRPFFVMEYVDGLMIDEYVVWNNLGLDDRLRLLIKVCRAVQVVHDIGIIHRDLKPANVLVDSSGAPRILDFGLAKPDTGLDTASSAFITRPEHCVGTLAFLSPEQVTGGAVDPRADVYALALLMHLMLTGTLPYSVSGNLLAVHRSIVEQEPASLASSARIAGAGIQSFDRDLECVMRKALEKDVDRRYSSARDFADDLEHYLNQEPVGARSYNRVYLLSKAARKHRRELAVAAVALVVLGAALASAVFFAFEKLAAEATGATRLEKEQRENVGLLNALQHYQGKATAFDDLVRAFPAVRASESARRRLPPKLAEWSDFEVISDVPDELDSFLGDPKSGAMPIVLRWLERHRDDLDRMDGMLREHWVRFAILDQSRYAAAVDLGPIAHALTWCKAFVARAYVRDASGDYRGAMVDLKASRRLACDMGDGISIMHKTFARTGRDLVFRFLQRTFDSHIAHRKPLIPYAEFVLEEPELAVISDSLHYSSLIVAQYLNESIAINRSGKSRFDFPELRGVGKLTIDGIGKPPIQELLDRFLWKMDTWERLPIPTLLRESDALHAAFLKEREDNAMLNFFPVIHNAYIRYVCANSSKAALQLLARVIQHHDINDSWPNGLDEIANLDPHDRFDPGSGQEFVYSLVDGLPEIHSAPMDGLQSETARRILDGRVMPWVAMSRQHLVYFPPRKNERN